MSESNVEFHSPEFIIGLQPRKPHVTWARLGERNPNDVYNSIRVVVIGSHEYKGYKGYIKSTTPDGYAFVELDSRLQQSVKIRLLDLASL